jgi:hypothetical protein
LVKEEAELWIDEAQDSQLATIQQSGCVNYERVWVCCVMYIRMGDGTIMRMHLVSSNSRPSFYS